MDQFSIGLQLTATEGSSHNLPTLVCMAWVTASTYNPLHQDAGRAAVLTRPNGGWGKLEAKEIDIPTTQLAELVDLMRRLGVPGRMPRVQARSGNPSGWQEITLDLSLGGGSPLAPYKKGRLTFGMQYAGLEGEDAVPCCAMLNRLFELLEVSYLGRWVGQND